MSDDRLFVSNNAIGRKWYFINMVILFVLTFVTNIVFTAYIIPNARTDVYTLIAQGLLYFAYILYIITFFSLIDRRLFDVCGSRDKNSYKNISGILKFIVFIHLFAMYCQWKRPQLPISVGDITMISIVLDLAFIVIIIGIGFIRGKITGMTYSEYKNKIKYE